MKFGDLVFGCNEPEVIHAEERQCHRQTEALLSSDKRVIFHEVKEVGRRHLWNNGCTHSPRTQAAASPVLTPEAPNL